MSKYFFPLLKKELFSLLRQPIFFIATAFLTLSSAFLFFIVGQFFVLGIDSSDLRFYFSIFPYISIITIPVLTMGQWEENVVFFDFILPISERVLVFTKWFSTLILAVCMLIPSVSIPICVSFFGDIEFAQIFCGYLGIICYFSAVCSFGLFLAIFFKNKITSFFITSLTLAVFSFSHLLTLQLQLPTWLARLCQQISFSWHFDAAGKGILDSRDFIFYLLVTFAFLLSSIFSLKTKKRGCL